jgi:hypothetical protein
MRLWNVTSAETPGASAARPAERTFYAWKSGKVSKRPKGSPTPASA